MGERMIGIRISITRYLSELDPQPGFVECELIDAHGQRHCFVEKIPVVTADSVDSQSTYPQPGVIACEIADRYRDESGREIIVIDTESPWGVESTDGVMRFEVAPASLIEWEWGSGIKRPWNGLA